MVTLEWSVVWYGETKTRTTDCVTGVRFCHNPQNKA